MTRRSEISGTMAAALATAYEHGGELIHYVGGFWSWRGCPRHSHNGNPEEYFGTTTIEGLVARQRMAYTEWKEGRAVRIEIAAKADLGRITIYPKDAPSELRQMKLHGIRVSLSSLDRR